MSASLVGSEMCIRDRPPTSTPTARWSTSSGPSPRGSRWRPPSGAAETSCCLLYTSDAADDM
eukprot:14327980-Alexandrium_andersonii.AAC.1